MFQKKKCSGIIDRSIQLWNTILVEYFKMIFRGYFYFIKDKKQINLKRLRKTVYLYFETIIILS
jgi:hypothetical protein